MGWAGRGDVDHILAALDGLINTFLVQQVDIDQFKLVFKKVVAACSPDPFDLVFIGLVSGGATDLVSAIFEEQFADVVAEEASDTCNQYSLPNLFRH